MFGTDTNSMRSYMCYLKGKTLISEVDVFSSIFRCECLLEVFQSIIRCIQGGVICVLSVSYIGSLKSQFLGALISCLTIIN